MLFFSKSGQILHNCSRLATSEKLITFHKLGEASCYGNRVKLRQCGWPVAGVWVNLTLHYINRVKLRQCGWPVAGVWVNLTLHYINRVKLRQCGWPVAGVWVNLTLHYIKWGLIREVSREKLTSVLFHFLFSLHFSILFVRSSQSCLWRAWFKGISPVR